MKVKNTQSQCLHSKTIELGYGIFCADCKIRVEFISKEKAEKKIEDTLLDTIGLDTMTELKRI